MGTIHRVRSRNMSKLSFSEKKKVLQQLASRVSTGLSFLKFNYLNTHKTPDIAWIRNIYILLSFYTELLLKSIYIHEGEFMDRNDMNKRLKTLGHNLSAIGSLIGEERLEGYGMSKIIDSGDHEYHIKSDLGEFYVTDFTDIRYDFIDDKIRVLNGDEHEMFERQIAILERANRVFLQIAYER